MSSPDSTTTRQVAHSVRAPQTCIRRTPFFIAAPSNVPPRRASIFCPSISIGTTSGRAATCLRRAVNAFLQQRDHQLRAGFRWRISFSPQIPIRFFQCPSLFPFKLLRSAFRARASRDSTACSPSRNIRAISVTPISSTYFRSNTSRCSGLQLGQGAIEFPIRTGVGRSRLVSYGSRAHQASAARIGADERKNFAMRDCAGEGEQRAVAAEKWQRLGQRDEGLLQHIVGLGALTQPSEFAMKRRMRAA